MEYPENFLVSDDGDILIGGSDDQDFAEEVLKAINEALDTGTKDPKITMRGWLMSAYTVGECIRLLMQGITHLPSGRAVIDLLAEADDAHAGLAKEIDEKLADEDTWWLWTYKDYIVKLAKALGDFKRDVERVPLVDMWHALPSNYGAEWEVDEDEPEEDTDNEQPEEDTDDAEKIEIPF